jgi:hypothetical protein
MGADFSNAISIIPPLEEKIVALGKLKNTGSQRHPRETLRWRVSLFLDKDIQ